MHVLCTWQSFPSNIMQDWINYRGLHVRFSPAYFLKIFFLNRDDEILHNFQIIILENINSVPVKNGVFSIRVGGSSIKAFYLICAMFIFLKPRPVLIAFLLKIEVPRSRTGRSENNIVHMMTLLNGNISRYWPFVRGIHRHRWIPHTKASDAEL